MKRLVRTLALMGIAFNCGTPAKAQITAAGDAFLSGDFVEVGVHPNGGFGSSDAAPVGYHPDVPGTGNALGFVADPEKDGWLVSVPPSPNYMGDYFVPGDPYEGWTMQAGSMALAWGRGRDLSSGVTSYGNVSYTTTGTQSVTVWQGSYGNLAITQTTTLKKDKLYFVMNVDIVNTGSTSINGVYYFRGVDPDNEEVPAGPAGFTTNNEVVYQPNATSTKCLVTATGLSWPYMSYLGLGTKDCRAKCMIMSPWQPSSLNETYSGLGSGSGYWRNVGDHITADYALGLVFNLGTLAPGQKTSLAYTYILKKQDLDSALQETEPKFVSDGISFAPYSTFRVCPGKKLDIKIANGGQYKWIWTPSTDMNAITGTSIVGPGGTLPTVTGSYVYADGAALGDSISVNVYGPKEYRATGISNCDTQVLIFYVDTISFAVAPAVTTPVRYCEGDAAAALTAGSASGASLRWYSVPAGGTFTTAPPTPATTFSGTTDYDTTSYYVSQVNAAGCETPRARIDVIITRKPSKPVVTDQVYCKGMPANQVTADGTSLRWYDAASGGTRYTSTPTPVTNTAGVVSYFVSQTVNGCESDRAQLNVETSQIIAAFSNSKDSVCGTDTILFTNRSASTAVADTSFSSLWNFGDGTGDTTRDAAHAYPGVRSTHTIQLKVTNIYGCADSVSRTVDIFPQPVVSVSVSDSVICQGDAVDFSGAATPGYNALKWDFADDDDSYNTLQVRHAFSKPGHFVATLTATYPACAGIGTGKSITVTQIPLVDLGRDTSLCSGSSAILLSNHSGIAAHYLWNTGDTTASIMVVHEGDYWLRASNGACAASDSISVTKSCYLDIPNAFIPGGDELSASFMPRQLLSKGVVTFNMKVFDRWGQQVFESDKVDGRGWDGTFEGKPMPMDVYVYKIKVSFSNGITESYQGNVTLIR